jgi:hypothetical protein
MRKLAAQKNPSTSRIQKQESIKLCTVADVCSEQVSAENIRPLHGDEVEQLSPSQMVQIMKVHSDSSSVVELAQERIYVLMIHIGAIKIRNIYLVLSKVVKQISLCISNDCICI